MTLPIYRGREQHGKRQEADRLSVQCGMELKVEQPKNATYASKHEYDRPHHPGESSNLKSGLLAGFVINFGKHCWNDADEKTYDHSKTTQQLEKGGLPAQNDESVT